MKLMNKIFKTILIFSVIIFSTSFLFVNSAQAGTVRFGEEDIYVDFDELPFDLSNWAPGVSTPLKTITITNGEDFDVDVFLKTSRNEPIPGEGEADLADVLTLTIEGQSKHISDLFTKSMQLALVNAGKYKNYDISMSFDQDAGNEYQGKTINFDFIIIAGQIGGEEEDVIIPGGVSGGASVLLPGLNILDESIRVTNIEETSITIIWTTSYFSTSRVIYDTISHPTLGNPPNYGYIFSTPEQDQDPKVTFHSVRIDGLTLGTTYFYRIVSKSSPEEVSREYSFTTKGVAGEKTEEEEGEESPEVWTGPEGTIPPTGGVPIVEGATTQEEAEEPIAIFTPEVSSSLLADIASIFGGLSNICYPCFPWWIILILAIYPLMESALDQRRDKRKAKKWLILSLGLIVLAIIFYLTNYYCVAIWIYFALALSTLLFWRFVDPRGRKYPFIVGLFIILILFIIWLILKCLYIWIILIAILIYLFIVDFLKKREKRE